jgi:hypothetical protein
MPRGRPDRTAVSNARPPPLSSSLGTARGHGIATGMMQQHLPVRAGCPRSCTMDRERRLHQHWKVVVQGRQHLAEDMVEIRYRVPGTDPFATSIAKTTKTPRRNVPRAYGRLEEPELSRRLRVLPGRTLSKLVPRWVHMREYRSFTAAKKFSRVFSTASHDQRHHPKNVTPLSAAFHGSQQHRPSAELE